MRLLKQIQEGKLDTSESFQVDMKIEGRRVRIKAPNGYQVTEPGPSKPKDDLSCTSPIPAASDEPVVVKLSKSM